MLRDYLKTLKNICPEIQIGYPCFGKKLIVRIPENKYLEEGKKLCQFLKNSGFTYSCDWKNKASFILIWKQ